MANRDYGKNCSTAVKKMADGGSVGESVGFWERIKAGNIDAEGSEANMRWGSGAKKMDAELDAASASFKDLPTNTGSPAPAAAPAKVNVEQEAATSSGMRDKTPAEDKTPAVDDVKPVESRAVNRVAPSGKSLGTGIASGYAAMENSKAAHAALQKKKTPAAPAAKPAAPAASRPTDASQIPGNKGIETKEAERMAQIPGRTGNDTRIASLVNQIPMANGGMVGGNRNYGKK